MIVTAEKNEKVANMSFLVGCLYTNEETDEKIHFNTHFDRVYFLFL